MGTFSSAGNIKGNIFVNINWGVKDLDRSDVGSWDSEYAGNLIWDDEFEVTSPESQKAFLDFCTELRDESDLVIDNDVTCWILDLDDFVKEDSNQTEKLPISDKDRFEDYLMRFISETETGGDFVKGQLLGFDVNTGKLKFMRVIAKSAG